MWLVVGALVACQPPPLDFVPAPTGDDTGGPPLPTGDTGAPPLGVPTDRPLRLLFLGNSFTAQGPVASLVRELAASVGWPAPETSAVAPGGQGLDDHRRNPASLDRVDAGGWDVVVLQDHSTRPTDVGEPDAFKQDATWFYDRIKERSPKARVVLFETWARHPAHYLYPDTYADPADMQAQLRFHYEDAVYDHIPANATFVPPDDVALAPVGDAWEAHLAEPDPLELFAPDLYHGGPAGHALTAMVLYSTIYGVVATGTGPLTLPSADAARLQASADATTGITEPPPALVRPGFGVDRTVEVDFGVLVTDGLNSVTNCLTGGASALVDTRGDLTDVAVRITRGFTGSNENGVPSNALGWPATVSEDVCWVGSFDSHALARLERATVTLSNLDPGRYLLVLFASREGDDNGAGRLTRYTVGGRSADLEASDNTSGVAVFDALVPDSNGDLTVDVSVSPEGSARFGYLGALTLTRTSAVP